jgi:hypothetical protein
MLSRTTSPRYKIENTPAFCKLLQLYMWVTGRRRITESHRLHLKVSMKEN